MEIIGTLKLKKDTQRVSERFQKREFVLTTEGNTPYPQHVLFQLTQDKCTMLDTFREGDELRVQFNLRGREWDGGQGVKYFVSLDAWRIEKLQSGGLGAGQSQQSSAAAAPASTAGSYSAPADESDDLPF
jgi:hypothetical protein